MACVSVGVDTYDPNLRHLCITASSVHPGAKIFLETHTTLGERRILVPEQTGYTDTLGLYFLLSATPDENNSIPTPNFCFNNPKLPSDVAELLVFGPHPHILENKPNEYPWVSWVSRAEFPKTLARIMDGAEIAHEYPKVYYALNCALGFVSPNLQKDATVFNPYPVDQRYLFPDPGMSYTTAEQLEIAKRLGDPLLYSLGAMNQGATNALSRSSNPDSYDQLLDFLKKNREKIIKTSNEIEDLVRELATGDLTAYFLTPDQRTWPHISAEPYSDQEILRLKAGDKGPIIGELERELEEIKRRRILALKLKGTLSSLALAEENASPAKK